MRELHPMLEFRGVDTHYGDLHVLKSVDYRIERGEVVCLLGGNASGKSTTMKAIMGSVRPTAGMNPAETLELADQIQSLNRHGLTILLIEHKLDVVAMLADKVVVLDHGEKIAEGSPEAVRRDEGVIRAYLGRSAACV